MKVLLFLVALGCAASGARAGTVSTVGDLGPSGFVVSKAVAALHDLAVAPAALDTPLRWAAWSDGVAGDATTHLVLFSARAGLAEPTWSTSWSHAYGPTLKPTPEWVFDGRPLVAMTYQFGAAAEQVDLYGLDRQDHPVRLAEMLAVAIEWKIAAAGDLLMVVYDTRGATLIPRCYAWRAGLQPADCSK